MMILVNFRPWRTRRRYSCLRRVSLTAGSAGLLIISLASLQYIMLKERIHQQQGDLQQYSLLLTTLTAPLKEQARLSAQLRLEKERSQRFFYVQQQLQNWQKLWQTLSQILPERVWLTSAEQRLNQLTLKGLGGSLKDLSDFRDQLLNTHIIRQANFGLLKRISAAEYQFELNLQLRHYDPSGPQESV